MGDGTKHTVSEIVQILIDAGENPEAFKPGGDHQLTNWVEWIIAHKGCGKPLTGMSPQNGWCKCLMSTGIPPETPRIMGWKVEDCEAYAAGYKAGTAIGPKSSSDPDLQARCEAAEKEAAKLNEKLDKASRRIAELMKKSE